jgi:RNA polymerase sigma-70 factor (ECF subfamily)
MAEQGMTLKDATETKLFLPCQDNELVLAQEEALELSFEEVFSRYHHTIFQLAHRVLGNYDDALELAQEVFLTVFRKLHTFRGESSLKTWLYRITLNKASNKLRWWKVRRRNQSVSIEGMNHAALMTLNLAGSHAIRTPEQCTIGSEVAEGFQRCLQQLTVKYRLVVVLRDLQGLSYEEIADATGLSIGTVKSRLARAREQLRDLLDRYL